MLYGQSFKVLNMLHSLIFFLTLYKQGIPPEIVCFKQCIHVYIYMIIPEHLLCTKNQSTLYS